VDNLEKAGIVERIVSEEDRRAFFVRLTPKGRRLFNKIFIRHAEYVAKLASVLTESEQADLGRLLKKLGTGLNNAK
jgi:MarR family 2-MHQ and catechol resistance regulon transcriptional repressor